MSSSASGRSASGQSAGAAGRKLRGERAQARSAEGQRAGRGPPRPIGQHRPFAHRAGKEIEAARRKCRDHALAAVKAARAAAAMPGRLGPDDADAETAEIGRPRRSGRSNDRIPRRCRGRKSALADFSPPPVRRRAHKPDRERRKDGLAKRSQISRPSSRRHGPGLLDGGRISGRREKRPRIVERRVVGGGHLGGIRHLDGGCAARRREAES